MRSPHQPNNGFEDEQINTAPRLTSTQKMNSPHFENRHESLTRILAKNVNSTITVVTLTKL